MHENISHTFTFQFRKRTINTGYAGNSRSWERGVSIIPKTAERESGVLSFDHQNGVQAMIMNVDANVIVAVCTVIGVGGSAVGWGSKHLMIRRNGHTPLTKGEHALICAPIKQSLEEGHAHFTTIESQLNMLINALINKGAIHGPSSDSKSTGD